MLWILIGIASIASETIPGSLFWCKNYVNSHIVPKVSCGSDWYHLAKKIPLCTYKIYFGVKITYYECHILSETIREVEASLLFLGVFIYFL